MKTKLILLFLFLTQFFTSLFAQSWQSVSQMPYPVKGAQAIVKDSVIYIFGGYSDSLLSGTRRIQAYYPNSNTWKSVEKKLTIPRYGHSVELYHDHVYIFGGSSISNDSAYAMENWNFDTQPYIHISEKNFNRKFASSVINGDYIYLFGGYPDFQLFDSLKYLYQYHIPTATHTDSFSINDLYSDELPSSQMSVSDAEKIYIIGGVYNGISRDINIFDLQNHSWAPGPVNLIRARAGGSAVHVSEDTQIVILGGFNETEAALNSIELYDYVFNTIQDGPELIYARAECCAVKFENRLFVFGGKDADDKIVSQVEMINLPISSATPIENEKKYFSVTDFEQVSNYPNPFNPEVRIKFKVNNASLFTLNIYDIQGNLIRCLLQEQLPAGWQEITWKGKDTYDNSVSSGIYFYQIKSEDHTQTNRMLLIR